MTELYEFTGCGIISFSEGNPDAKLLYDELLVDYNRLIRPVANASETVTVKLGLRLSQLMEVVSVFYF